MPRARCIVFLLAAVALLTLPKLSNGFVWDDIPLIVESDFIHSWANLPTVFRVDTMYAADAGKFQASAQLDTYRPVTMLTFFVDAAISGREPLAYHIDNLLAHLLCVWLVYLLGVRLMTKPRWAVGAAAWFGLHPSLGEAHLWINGRSDLWCTVFGLAGFVVWHDAKHAPRARALRLVLSAMLFLLGMLSKESLLPALVVSMLWNHGVFQRPLSQLDVSRTSWLWTSPLLVAITAYLLLRAQALGGMHVSAGGPQLSLALARLPALLLDGAVGVLFPTTVMPRYLAEVYAGYSGLALGGCALVCLCVAVAVFRMRARRPLLSFGVVWFAAVLAPTSLIATLQWYGFGRYLYLPMTVLTIAVVDVAATAFTALQARATARTVLFVRWGGIGFVGLLGIRLLFSVGGWDGPDAFYGAIIAEQPTASHGYGGLGKWRMDQGSPASSVAPLQRAVAINPGDSRYLNNLGVAYLRTGRNAEAVAVAELGLRRFPTHAKFEELRQLALAGAR